ncbi:unnamed protein product [Pleuronectes platessa]|uniref:Uncharacterized protein n=1 Tax=Pleuronectes platessa TaxID=8262 RepID=A0A9N7V027_PLEPL|nr:unnamed protein product [Pleuronectes platessa]
MATWSVTVGPPDLPRHLPPLPQTCSPCPRSLCWGQEGGITPGMIPYYWARLPFSTEVVCQGSKGLQGKEEVAGGGGDWRDSQACALRPHYPPIKVAATVYLPPLAGTGRVRVIKGCFNPGCRDEHDYSR